MIEFAYANGREKFIMNIRPSSALRNEYPEMSRYCKERGEPVFLTVNGREDTVLLSAREYERQQALLELLDMLSESQDDIKCGRVFTHEEATARINAKLQELRN